MRPAVVRFVRSLAIARLPLSVVRAPVAFIHPVPSRMASSATEGEKPMENMILSRITERLSPAVLLIENESYKHAVPKGSETHFKVLVVSNAFDGKSVLERHRMVMAAVCGDSAPVLPAPLHALSISAKTTAQYKPDEGMQVTPACKGGTGK